MSSGLRGPLVSGIRPNADWSKFCRLSPGGAQQFTLVEEFFDPTPTSNLVTSGTDFQLGTRFIPGASYTITKLAAYLLRSGTMNAITCTMAVYTESGGLPDSQIGPDSTSFLCDSHIGLSLAWVEFPGLSATVTNGVTYWIVYKNSAAQGGPQVGWAFDTFGGGSMGFFNGAWNAAFAGNKGYYRTFS